MGFELGGVNLDSKGTRKRGEVMLGADEADSGRVFARDFGIRSVFLCSVLDALGTGVIFVC